jgi:hypothetical protein
MATLTTSEPDSEILETPERTCGLGQLGVARTRRSRRSVVDGTHSRDEVREFGEAL